MSDIPHYLDKEHDGTGVNMDDVVTRVCVCGGTWFRTIITIDENYEISAYGLDGECVECGTRVKLPCPVDRTD